MNMLDDWTIGRLLYYFEPDLTCINELHVPENCKCCTMFLEMSTNDKQHAYVHT